jgi:hypothetical protein
MIPGQYRIGTHTGLQSHVGAYPSFGSLADDPTKMGEEAGQPLTGFLPLQRPSDGLDFMVIM